MSKHLIFKLQSELYPHVIGFIIGPRPDDKLIGRVCREVGLWDGTGDEPCASDGEAATVMFSCGCVVWLPEYKAKDGIDWLATFNHELIHILQNASDHMGIQLTEQSAEFHCYYGAWITKKVMTKVLRSMEKSK